MPRRNDIHRILLIGSGPIVIGQACEFDYSGTQACKALREEGYEVILVNSNPATIMTDPATANRTYIEPLTPEFVDRKLNLQANLANARSDAAQAVSAYNIALARLEAAKGTLLRYNNVIMEENTEGPFVSEALLTR